MSDADPIEAAAIAIRRRRGLDGANDCARSIAREALERFVPCEDWRTARRALAEFGIHPIFMARRADRMSATWNLAAYWKKHGF